MPYVAASHEDPADPGSLKRVLFTLKDFPKSHILQMINWAKIEPGKSFRTHYHEDMDEVFIIMKGSATILVDGMAEAVGVGDAMLITAGSRHRMENRSDSVVEYLVIGVSQDNDGKTILT